MRTLGKTIIGVLVALVMLLGVAIWGLAHGWARVPVERFATKKMERPVKMADLRIYVLSRTPYAQVDGLQVANPDWVQKAGDTYGQMVDLGRGEVALRVLPLLHGEVRLARLVLDNGNIDLLREVSGRANWAMGASKPVSDSAPLQLPIVEQFVVRDSRIRLADAVSKMGFEGNFATQEGDVKTGQPFELTGKGMLNAQPFRLQLTGGSVESALENKTYPFSLNVVNGATKITAKGTFTNPLDFCDFTAAMTLEGKNLADLYYLTGLALPKTRAYSLKGNLTREGRVYKLAGLQGKLGSSDLDGNLQVDTTGARPFLTADLQSRLLDPADAGVVFGGELRAIAAAPKYLLPDAPLELARLRGMDAKVTYKAAAVNVDNLPLKQVDLTLTLDNGKLTLAPLSVTLPQGTVSGSLVIDASKDIPAMNIDVRLSGARLEDFMAKAGQPNAIEGPIVARVKMVGSGKSFHEAASHADGTAAVAVPHGQIRQAFAELLGINAARGLGMWLSGDQQQVGLRCGIASFDAKGGTLYGQHIVLDTDTVVTVGSGKINLADESLDLSLRGKAKEARLVKLMTPIKITGTLSKPGIGVGLPELGVQAGVATAVGVVLTPLAAIIPFLDAGLADNADCATLMSDAREVGVKGTAR